MYIIREYRMKFGMLYEKAISNNNSSSLVGATGFIRKSNLDNKYYFIIFNQEGELINDANKYLNVILINAGYKTRERAFNGLKIMYSYALLFNLRYINKDINDDNINQFITFLNGGEHKSTFVNLDIKSTRNKNTIKGYLNIYDHYFKVIFNMDRTPFKNNYFYNIYSTKKTNKSLTYKILDTPKYIKFDEYKKIISLIKVNYSQRDKIIIQLMYEYGLRIGEVLGLTIEDINNTGNEYKLYLRNRTTDKPWQLSKGLVTPVEIHDYNNSIFKNYGSGFQIIHIDKNLFVQLNDYLEESRSFPMLIDSKIKLRNLNEYCNADIIDGYKNLAYNQYVFLSKNLYKPLTAVGWNNVLRKIFEESGITVDQARRESNLNHRFRHGFAMKLVKRGLDPNELAKKLRHKSVISTYRYYNPDEHDQYEILLKYKDSIGEKYSFD